jgi:hypothetical protein
VWLGFAWLLVGFALLLIRFALLCFALAAMLAFRLDWLAEALVKDLVLP